MFVLSASLIFNVSGTKDKRRSLHDGLERRDIPSFLVYYICFAGEQVFLMSLD
jgi:hypothetical protein